MKWLRTTSDDSRMQALLTLLNQELRANYGDEQDTYDKFNVFETPIKAVLILIGDKAIACGAFKEMENDKVEIKRMYVKQAFRRKGYSTKILKALEKWALELGFKQAVLETGNQQKAAIALYTKLGYKPISCYPPYNKMPSSLCFAKQLN